MDYTLRQGKLGIKEAVSLCCILVLSRMLFMQQWYAVDGYLTHALLAPLGSALIGLVVLMLGMFVIVRSGTQDIVEALTATLGKALGRVCALSVAVALMHGCSASISEIVVMFRQYSYPNTPYWCLIAVFMLGVLPLVLMGFESIARTAKMIVFIGAAAFVFLIAGSLIKADPTRLYPLWAQSGDAVREGFEHSGLFLSLIGILVVGKSLQGNKHTNKTLLVSLSVTAGLMLVFLLVRNLTISSEITHHIKMNAYEMAALVNTGKMVQRLDAALMYIMVVGVLIAVAFMLYSASNIYCRSFCIRDLRPPALIWVLCVGLWSALSLNNYHAVNMINDCMYTYNKLFYCVPIVLAAPVAIIKFRSKGAKKA